MKNFTKVMVIIGVFILGILIAFGINTIIVWGICKIMGWTFTWKWVILFTICCAISKSLFGNKNEK